MKAGQMRHRLGLESPTVAQDTFGGAVKTWTRVADVSASIDSVTGREFLAADRELAGITWRITIRETPDFTVEPNWRGVDLDQPTRVFDFVALLPSHAREQVTIAATCGQSQP